MSLISFVSQPAFTHPNFDNAYSVMPRKGVIGDWKNLFSQDDQTLLTAQITPHRPVLDRYPWESTAHLS